MANDELSLESSGKLSDGAKKVQCPPPVHVTSADACSPAIREKKSSVARLEWSASDYHVNMSEAFISVQTINRC